MAKSSEGESSNSQLELQQPTASNHSRSRKSLLPNFQSDIPEHRIYVEYDTEETGLELNLKSKGLRQAQLNDYIVDWVGAKQQRKTRDIRLWKEYIQSFKDWTIDTFNIANEQACNDLRDFLRTNDVSVNADPKKKVQYALNDVLNEDRPHIWTVDISENLFRTLNKRFRS